MKTTIVAKGSMVRCYKCGSTEVHAICHHCGRPMCDKHGPVKLALSWFTENREFEKLSLEGWPFQVAEGAHCEFHVHSTLNYRHIMLYPGILIAVVGLVLLASAIISMVQCLTHRPASTVISQPALSEVLRDPAIYAQIDEMACYPPQTVNNVLALFQAALILGFGLGALYSGMRLNRESAGPDVLKQGITLPLGPATNKVRVVESLTVNVNIQDDGTATSEIVDGIQGEIIPGFVFTTQDVQRVGEYRRKHKLTENQNLAFHSGYMVLKGNPYLTPILDKSGTGRTSQSDGTSYQIGMKNVINIGGHTQDFPFFSDKNSASSLAWRKSWCYTVKKDDVKYSEWQREGNQPPIWILPVFFERGKTKLLVLMVQLNINYFPDLSKVLDDKENAVGKKVWIERAKLEKLSHLQFGKPEVENGMISESEDYETKYYDIEWHDSLLTPHESRSKNIIFDGFRMFFDSQIALDARVKGNMVLRVPSLVSNIQFLEYYSALGQPAKKNDRDVEQELITYLHVDFNLALAKTLISEFSASPCAAIEAPGAPTPRRLNHILNCFHSESHPDGQIFIHRVVESQPQLGNEDLHAGRWHWQIFGKRYHEITPIDFHIVIFGHGDQGNKGVTRIETSIMANVDEDRAWQVEETKNKIESILRSALKTDGIGESR